jgi:phosphoribosylaminoimidazolecarboxamide formyltransferase/IMP cyclohydrolase
VKKRALFSVSDKTGAVDFAKRLEALGYEIVSSDGTYAHLRDGGVDAVSVASITQFPECFNGRVKTLHPMIHGGILAQRDNPDHMAQLELLGITPIDVVVINLYPFEQTVQKPGVTLEEAIENIDIGGPALIRASAKNWRDVVVVTSPEDYGGVIRALEAGGLSPAERFALAQKVFAHTARYDGLIAAYLGERKGEELQ